MSLRLIGEVALDGSGFEAGLKKIEHSAERVGETLKGLALTAFGVYGIEQAIHKTVETAEKLVDTSRRLGVGLEALQEFGFAAKQNGADIDALTGFIEKLNSTRIDPKKFESFAKLGISQPDLSSLKVEDLIMKLSFNLRNRSAQEVIGPLREIGGRGAGQLLPMLKEDMEEVREEARKLGVVMKTEDAVMLKFLADEMTILSQVIVSALAPAIVFLEEKILRFVNVLKANGSFWGDLAGRLKPKDFVTMVAAPFLTKGELESAGWKRIDEAIQHAGALSQTTLDELDDMTDKQIADLVKRQKEIERINAIPDFENVMGEGKEKRHGGTQVYTDSLLRVGNFLGSAQNPMVSIGHTHTRLLQAIAQNTAKRATGGNEPGRQFPHHG
jgi:hypothetical protein